MAYGLSFAGEFFSCESDGQSVESSEPWSLISAIERLRTDDPDLWRTLANEWNTISYRFVTSDGVRYSCRTDEECDACEDSQADHGNHGDCPGEDSDGNPCLCQTCNPCACPECKPENYPPILPEHLAVSTVYRQCIEVGTCTDIRTPVSVWIDRDGWYTVEVHDQPDSECKRCDRLYWEHDGHSSKGYCGDCTTTVADLVAAIASQCDSLEAYRVNLVRVLDCLDLSIGECPHCGEDMTDPNDWITHECDR